jgi:hypothetical protein
MIIYSIYNGNWELGSQRTNISPNKNIQYLQSYGGSSLVLEAPGRALSGPYSLQGLYTGSRHSKPTKAII